MQENLTDKQRELLSCIGNDTLTLGSVVQRYYKGKSYVKSVVPIITGNTPYYRGLKQSMKRNSQMSGWLNRLTDKGFISQTYKGSDSFEYYLTNLAKKLIK